jgi:antitoxin component of RelBE/YafQ-DinJ toxin-antitoxin module
MSNLARKHQINTRLNDIELKKLQAFADENGINISEAMRLLIQRLPQKSN